MSVAPLIFPSRLPRWRVALAGVLLAAGFSCLWMGAGLSVLLPSVTRAVAEPSSASSGKVPDSVLSVRRADLLRSCVDSLALGLGGALVSLDDEAARTAVLASALSSVTFDLGADVYFTAWQGTRMLHSPRTPDTVGMDFAEALDLRGTAFVQATREMALHGGFMRVSLSGPAGGQASLEQVVYARAIPGSDAHIAAFMPLDPAPVAGEGFSPVWRDAALSAAGTRQSRRDMRDGLCVSGMSLIGLAGVVVIPGRRGAVQA